MPVGETLARAREARGLSVDEVSRATRIRGTLVRSIEADDFAPCGGAVYARGHLRSIARVVGIDPEPLIAEFDAEHGGPPGGPVPLAPFDPDIAERTERRRPNWTAAMVVALLVVIGLAGVQLATSSKGSHGDQAATTPSATVQPTRTTSAGPSSTPASPPPSAVAQLPRDGVTVLMRVVRDKSWCGVKDASGRVLFQGLMTAGQSRTFHDAKQLSFVIGNAPAVDLVVNGKEIGAPPSQGNVARVSFGPGGPTGSQG